MVFFSNCDQKLNAPIKENFIYLFIYCAWYGVVHVDRFFRLHRRCYLLQAMVGAAFSVGFIVGPILGALIGAGAGGGGYAAWLALAFAGAAVVVLILALPETLLPEDRVSNYVPAFFTLLNGLFKASTLVGQSAAVLSTTLPPSL